MKIGWNVLMKTDKAAEYISNGIKQKGLWIKTIFSKKNTERENKLKTKLNKLPKREFISPHGKQNEQNINNNKKQ